LQTLQEHVTDSSIMG